MREHSDEEFVSTDRLITRSPDHPIFIRDTAVTVSADIPDRIYFE